MLPNTLISSLFLHSVMCKKNCNRIITLFLLGTIMVPILFQFFHSFESHALKSKKVDGIEYIQNIQDSCALYHNQINHNTVILQFGFDINFLQIINQAIQINFVELHQSYFNFKSSRAPPVSFV